MQDIPWEQVAVTTNSKDEEFRIETQQHDNGLLLRIRFLSDGRVKTDDDNLYKDLNAAFGAAMQMAG